MKRSGMWQLYYGRYSILTGLLCFLRIQKFPFSSFVLAAFTLCVVRSSSNWTYVLAGILLIIGNYIRPLSILFLVTIVAYMILQHARTLHYCGLILPCVLGAILLGQVSKNNTGVFAFQSSTSGVNLIMTSHDEAYGGVNTTILSDTTSICYINEADKLTFVEKDAIWKSRAIQWIKDHPAKASFLYIKKLFGLWVEDSWSDRPVIGGGGAVDRGINGGDRSAFIRQILHMMSCSIVYYLVLILFVVGLIKERSLWIKNRKTEEFFFFYWQWVSVPLACLV